jgi:phosphatidylserine/phosphatidylglycerophosphate/cardiolipin synthase-like enzyme
MLSRCITHRDTRTRVGPARRVFRRTALALLAWLSLSPAQAATAQERMLFPAVDNAQAVILEKIRNERVRVDVAVWYLVDREITMALVEKHNSGVPVRVIGDRAAIFEADPNTRTEFELLAAHGVPIRLRYHPTWFPEIMHWKCGIFVGQNLVEFGSANWTYFELRPWSPTNFKDETVMFTDDSTLVRAFLTMFDRMWVDTTHFLDWHAAYAAETGRSWTTPMSISRARLEPDYPTNIPGMVWSQGAELNTAMAAEIDQEGAQIEMVIYRLSDPGITDALIRRRQAGVPVRIVIEPLQYRQPDWPEYWLTGARIDQLWLAGAQIKERVHEGLTHMKTLITSRVALNGSANFTRNWQRDHNYFISATTKPALYLAMRDRFDAMWRDTTHYRDFSPQRPEEPLLVGPGNGTTGVSTLPKLEWRRARWAVAFDVLLGTSPQTLTHQGRVNAQLDESPPDRYSWRPGQPLQPDTTYYWQIVSRTFATVADPSLSVASTHGQFTTGPGTSGTAAAGETTGVGCVGSAPAPGWFCLSGAWVPPDSLTGGVVPPPPPPPAPPPPSGGTTTCATPSPGDGWTCVNGGWLPPGHPDATPSAAPPPPPPPAPAPPPVGTSTCATPSPGVGWTCVNGGWLPPGHPDATPSAAPPPPPPPAAPPTGGTTTCATPPPGVGWTCVNGGWLPPGHPAATPSTAPLPPPPPPPAAAPPTGGTTTCATPPPGVGWTCVNGGWLPPGHPGATSGAAPSSSPASVAPSGTTCATPDPFVAIGGGVCIDGGWRPRH